MELIYHTNEFGYMKLNYLASNSLKVKSNKE